MILSQEDNEKPTSMDISSDNLRLVVGYSKGSISLFDLNSGKLIKKFQNLSNSAILFVKFLARIVASNSKEKILLIIGNSDDKIFKYKWVEKKILGIKSKNIIPIENLNYYFNVSQILDGVTYYYQDKQNFKVRIVAISTLHKIFIIDLDNLKEPIFELKKPDFIESQFNPFIFWDDYLRN